MFFPDVFRLTFELSDLSLLLFTFFQSYQKQTKTNAALRGFFSFCSNLKPPMSGLATTHP